MGVPKFRDFVKLVMKRKCFENTKPNVCFDKSDLTDYLSNVMLPVLNDVRRQLIARDKLNQTQHSKAELDDSLMETQNNEKYVEVTGPEPDNNLKDTRNSNILQVTGSDPENNLKDPRNAKLVKVIVPEPDNSLIESQNKKQNEPASRPSKENKKRLGLYMDMASLLYGVILKTLEESDEGRSFMASMCDDKKAVCNLSDKLVDKISTICCNRICERYSEYFFIAYRLFFSWDTDPPNAKRFTQTKRHLAKHITVSRQSRIACYRETLFKVRRVIIERYMTNLKLFDIPSDESIARVVEKYIDAQMGFLADNDRLQSRQMLLNRGQLFAVGEGEWKCFYQILQDTQSDVVDVAEVFGNDWDIGVGSILLHETNIHIYYRCKPDEWFSMSFDRPLNTTEKTLYFMALNMLGNDYTFSLVGDSVTNLKSIERAIFYLKHEGLYFGDALPIFLNGALKTGNGTASAERQHEHAIILNGTTSAERQHEHAIILNGTTSAEQQHDHAITHNGTTSAERQHENVITHNGTTSAERQHENAITHNGTTSGSETDARTSYASVGTDGRGKDDCYLFSRSFSEVLTTLLLSVYTDCENRQVPQVLHYENERTKSIKEPKRNRLRQQLYKSRRESVITLCAASTSTPPPVKRKKIDQNSRLTKPVVTKKINDCIVYDENTLITCRTSDGSRHMRTLQMVMDAYVTSTLWYASYCQFYKFIKEPARHTFMNGLSGAGSTVMDIGLPMLRPFVYNDERMSQDRFEICSLLEMKKILKNITPCLLFWIIENSVANLCGLEEEELN